jgi:multiple sugar transport system permease protein
MVPTQVSIIGFYRYMAIFKLTNSYIPLILPAIAAPSAIFFAKQYLESVVVKELIDAARIDGCGELGIFHRIMLPIAKPGAFTLGIFAFVGSWNNFFTPFIMISKMNKYTLPMLVQTLRGDTYRTEYGSIYLGLVVSIIPIIIVYAIFSKYIVNGIAMGAVKE